jgi:regulator of sigma E protease
MATAISNKLGETVEITLERSGEILSVNLIPRVEYPEGRGPIGVSLRNPTKEVGWGQAFTIGLESAYQQVRELILLPGRLIQGELAPDQARISGLKGMYDMLSWAGAIDRSTERPFLTLNLVGVISLGLALANLIPFPALDGGRLLFIVVEVLLGRRIDQRYEGFAHTVGFFLLLAVLIYVNVLDFVDPIPLP